MQTRVAQNEMDMTYQQLQSLGIAIDRGRLASGFTDDRKTSGIDWDVPLKVEPPPITEDLSRFAGNQALSARVKQHWASLSPREKAKRNRHMREIGKFGGKRKAAHG